MEKYKSFGSFAVVAAAILWSLDGLLRRQLFVLPATVIVFWEHVIGFVVLLPVVLLTWRHFLRLNRRQWAAIVVVSLLSGALGTIFYTAALVKVQFIPFSVVVLLQQLQPIFAITASALILKESLSRRFVALAALAMVAAYGVSFPHLRVNLATGDGTAVAALLAVGAAASWGASTAISKYSLRDVSSLHVTAARFAFTPIFALLFAATLGNASKLSAISSAEWPYLIAITFSTGMVALALYYFGLKRIPASRSTILELAWPFSAVFVGVVFLHETLTVTQWISAAILTTTIYLIGRRVEK